jgi:MoxR-like ATPase
MTRNGTSELEASVAEVASRAEAVLDEISRVVVGKRPALELILCAALARSHVLIEDLPGLGKTLIARSFASALGLDFRRVQFTPDLLPADLTGTTVLDQNSGEFSFRSGPVFTNLLLADEINRTPPKTQAALLEAMAEEQVSADGRTHPLPQPFLVLATDNPIEYEGTYPLPEAQLDRFGIRVRLGYLNHDDEIEMLGRRVSRGSSEGTVERVIDAESFLRMRGAVEQVTVEPDLLDYVVRISAATREDKDVLVGASPRASLALLQLARAYAALSGRDYVIPEDVKTLAVPALAHRLSLRPEMWVRRVQAEDVLSRILSRVATPRSDSGSRPAAPERHAAGDDDAEDGPARHRQRADARASWEPGR